MQKMQTNFVFVVKTMSIIIDICLSVRADDSVQPCSGQSAHKLIFISVCSAKVQRTYSIVTSLFSSSVVILNDLFYLFTRTMLEQAKDLTLYLQNNEACRFFITSSRIRIWNLRFVTLVFCRFNLKSTLTYSIFLSTGHWLGRRLEAGAALCAGRWTLCPGAAAGTQLNVLFIFIFMFLFFFLGLISSRFSHSWTVNVTRLH